MSEPRNIVLARDHTMPVFSGRDDYASLRDAVDRPESTIPPRDNEAMPPRDNEAMPPRDNEAMPPRDNEAMPPRDNEGDR